MNKKDDAFKPQYLYIEDWYPSEQEIEEIKKSKEKEKDDDDQNRGVIVIDLF